MAFISSGVETEMVVRYQIGMVNGSPVIRQKSFSGLKTRPGSRNRTYENLPATDHGNSNSESIPNLS